MSSLYGVPALGGASSETGVRTEGTASACTVGITHSITDMAVNHYELTYIINPVISDDQTKSIVRKVNKYVEENGGSVLEVDEWGNQRLAYRIDKKRNGYYVNMYFKSPGDLTEGLERHLRLEDNVLRWLTLKMDAKMQRHFKKKQMGEIADLADVQAEEEEAEEAEEDEEESEESDE